MKKIIIPGVVALLLNLLLYFMISSVILLNFIISSIVIVYTISMLMIIIRSKIKPGYKISLSLLIPFFAFVEYLGAILMSGELKDNWVLIGILMIIIVQGILTYACIEVSSYLSSRE